MKVVVAYLLAVLGGNPQPFTKDLQAILGSVGAEAEDDMIRLLPMEVQGTDITELIATGREKFNSVPFGGGGGGGTAISVAAAGNGGGSTAAPAATESKKEEKVEEKEESNEEMGFSLFD